MADEPRDPDAAANRLEAALERIARVVAAQATEIQLAAAQAVEFKIAAARAAEIQAAQAAEIQLARAALIEATSNMARPEAALSIPEITERLDLLIGRLRAALGSSSTGTPASGTSAAGTPEQP